MRPASDGRPKVPRTCTVCAHEDRAELEGTLVAGVPLRTIADRFRVSKTALVRHKEKHLPASLAKAREAEEIANADGLLEQLRSLHGRTLAILVASEDAGDLRTALGAVREARNNLELLAKLLGEIDEAPRVNVLISAEWVAVRSALLEALVPYPEARAAGAAALLELEEGRG